MSKTLSKSLSSSLLCVAAFIGLVANASAGVGLRITLATAGPAGAEPVLTLPNANPAQAERVAAERAAAEAAARTKAMAQAQLRARAKALVKVYAAKSDAELTNLSARLQELPRLDRQVLLREVKMRMARQRGRKGSVQIRTERRFGRLLRQPDGSVVRVETRVVQVRPATKGKQVDQQASQRPARQAAYGTGFERRSAPAVPVSRSVAPAADQRPTQGQPTAAERPAAGAPQPQR